MENKHILAGYLYETNRRHLNNQNIEPFEVTVNKIPEILTSEKVPKTTMQKLNNFLLYLYNQNEYIGQEQILSDPINNPCCVYAKNGDEVFSMMYELSKLDYLASTLSGNSPHAITYFRLTAKGLERAEQLKETNVDSKNVFVAMGFSPDLLDACENAIKPACQSCGFDAFLISDKEHNKGITDEIIVAIKTSKFIIVDFTYNNCGAYFEAGYAQGHGLEVIRLCKDKWFNEKDERGTNINQLHFDIRHYNLILWKDHDDLIQKLKTRIRATITDAKMTD